ncbi:MAG: 23S rRNA (adenine(2503)-C(2))-methyltransferase RlmN [Bacteroidetes bacterium]|nr:23S rRNA (adenine(2503)-C(2))-methyltransferase RlmN [Bacteroidota bacterium]
MNKTNNKIEIKGLTLDHLKDFAESIGEKRFRGEQIFNWIYNHLAFNFDEMLNLSKEFREKLKELCELQNLQLVTTQNSSLSKTQKYLFKTYDNKSIESVVIPDENRNTLCISTQVGCPLDCKFCATGLMGYKRNLSSAEIIDQYLLAAKEYGKENITNIVYMGMGEPLLNFERTLDSLKIFTEELNKGLSRNRITVSTAGIAPKIKELADSGLRVKLALSLHSCFDDIRTKIMPINKKYPLQETINACGYYAEKTNTRITFEYTMLKGLNDRDEDVKALSKLCRKIPSKVNIIPFNSIKHMSPDGIAGELEPTSHKKLLEFADKLRNNNVTVMVRDTQGDDIAAACGQLAVKN